MGYTLERLFSGPAAKFRTACGLERECIPCPLRSINAPRLCVVPHVPAHLVSVGRHHPKGDAPHVWINFQADLLMPIVTLRHFDDFHLFKERKLKITTMLGKYGYLLDFWIYACKRELEFCG